MVEDTDGHNPHAHILLTMRPLNEDGTLQYKIEKEYRIKANVDLLRSLHVTIKKKAPVRMPSLLYDAVKLPPRR